MAGMFTKLWDDVAGGSPPDKGMKQLRKSSLVNKARFSDAYYEYAARNARRRICVILPKEKLVDEPTVGAERQRKSPNVAIKKPLRLGALDVDTHAGTPSSLGSTPPASPSTASPSSYSHEKDSIWRSVFHPGQNKVMRQVGLDNVDKAQPSSPSAYDWVLITALEG